MEMEQEKQRRLEAFEKMLSAVQEAYLEAAEKTEALKAQGREKSATCRQLMGNKLTYKNILSMYQIYGLIGEEGPDLNR